MKTPRGNVLLCQKGPPSLWLTVIAAHCHEMADRDSWPHRHGCPSDAPARHNANESTRVHTTGSTCPSLSKHIRPCAAKTAIIMAVMRLQNRGAWPPLHDPPPSSCRPTREPRATRWGDHTTACMHDRWQRFCRRGCRAEARNCTSHPHRKNSP